MALGTDIHCVFQAKIDGRWEDVLSNYNEERHYYLFAWLADVRNGFGFAGIRTHDPIKPIGPNRGYPEDFVVDDDMHPIPSNEHRGRSAEFYAEEDSNPQDPSHLKKFMGEHSHTWFTAEEILEPTPPKMHCCGVITLAQYRKWDGVSAPSTYCDNVCGRGVVVSEPANISDSTTHVRIHWISDAAETFAYFLNEVRRLKELHGEVRAVFGFDS